MRIRATVGSSEGGIGRGWVGWGLWRRNFGGIRQEMTKRSNLGRIVFLWAGNFFLNSAYLKLIRQGQTWGMCST